VELGSLTVRCRCSEFGNDAVEGQRSDESHPRFIERQSRGRCSCCGFDDDALIAMLWKDKDQRSYIECSDCRRTLSGSGREDAYAVGLTGESYYPFQPEPNNLRYLSECHYKTLRILNNTKNNLKKFIKLLVKSFVLIYSL
jgi:hypothetical protein